MYWHSWAECIKTKGRTHTRLHNWHSSVCIDQLSFLQINLLKSNSDSIDKQIAYKPFLTVICTTISEPLRRWLQMGGKYSQGHDFCVIIGAVSSMNFSILCGLVKHHHLQKRHSNSRWFQMNAIRVWTIFSCIMVIIFDIKPIYVGTGTRGSSKIQTIYTEWTQY